MLSQNERRRLEEIEQRLRDEDPEFAQLFTGPERPPSRRRRWWSWPMFLLVISGLGVLLAMAALSPALLLVSMVGTVAGWFWLVQWDRRTPGDGPSWSTTQE